MPKLSEILGKDTFKQVPEELQTKYKDIDLVDSSNYVVKEKYNNLDTTKKDIEGQLKTANKTIGDLKKDNTNNQTLQNKIDQYEKDYEKLKKDSEKKIQDMQFNYALEGALTKANVKNTKAVKALLNLDSIKLVDDTFIGLDEQVKSLKESDAYLFETETPGGTGNIGGGSSSLGDGDDGKLSLGARLAKERTEATKVTEAQNKFFE